MAILRHAAAAVLTLTLTLAGCATAGADADFSGLVKIAPGRSLYLNCQGSGSPTVFIIPGKGSYAEACNVAVPDDDPIRSSPYDLITQARIEPSPVAAQPSVAKGTRVCSYDRPNTRPDGADRSTPVPQPHSIQRDVADIVKLVSAAKLSTPLVVAAHSYGGLIADLLARTHPEMVNGLVLVGQRPQHHAVSAAVGRRPDPRDGQSGARELTAVRPPRRESAAR